MQRRVATAAIVVSIAFFAVAAPFAQVPLRPVLAFVPTYQSALIVLDLITAILLFGQLRYLRSAGLLALACGYLFTAFLAAAHALTFPGLFAPGGLLGAGPQTTAWLYMFWHGGFPLFVIAYALTRGELKPRAVALWIGMTLWVAFALTWIATRGHDGLPPIMAGNRYTPLMVVVVTSTWAFSVAALAAIWWRRRPHTTLDLCLMVVMLAWVFDIALAAVLNAGRFDLGFYAGRIYGFVAASLVLVMLLVENARLYKRLSDRTLEAERAQLAAKQAERAKSTFLATMSHEIRTPMNGVIGMLELLSLSRLEGEQRTTVEVVQQSARSLLRIIDDILDFSKVEAGKLELLPAPAFVATIVNHVCDVYAGSASSKGLLLDRCIDRQLDRPLMVDALRLQQILSNLVSNALKFTSQGGVLVRADLRERRDASDVVSLTVRDTGAGVSHAEAERLFKPFSQVGPGTAGGTGLGLSISQRLAELMGGKLEMASEPGAGTLMTLTITLQVAASAPAPVGQPGNVAPGRDVPTLMPPAIEEARRDGKLILVVDDHPINRLLLIKQLNTLGYAAVAAENGRDALEQWKADVDGIGAVITDCHMPEMDGYELARAIRSREGANGAAHVPVIAFTANVLSGEAVKCFAAGMDDYLSKPATLAQLENKLRQWLPRADPINRALLTEVTLGDAHLERQVLEQFRQSSREDSRSLRQAFEARDLTEVVRQAHRIKGASRSIGAIDLATSSEQLEHAGRSSDWDALESAMAGFEREVERLSDYLAPANSET